MSTRRVVVDVDELHRRQQRRALSQKDLAELSGVTSRTIRNWENGGNADLSAVSKVADALGCQSTDLILGADPPAEVGSETTETDDVVATDSPKPDSEAASPSPSDRNDHPGSVSPSSTATQHWNIPFDENPFFVGRDSYLENIRTRLFEFPVVALNGLGGIGKTETAIAYAHKFRKEHCSVFWILASSNEDLQAGMLRIYALLWPDREIPTTEHAAREAIRWLGENSGWLLIFDNADDPAVVKPYIPQQLQGHVLLTSRADVFRCLGISDPITLSPLDSSDALSLLCRSTCRENGSPEEFDAAHELLLELNGLPLALEQAAAYIAKGASFSDYLTSYRKRKILWLEEGPADSRGYSKSVATTWQINFDAVRSECLASSELLRFTSFLSPDAIPFELLVSGSSKLGDVLAEALQGADQEPLKVHQLLYPLASYSLIRIDGDKRVYSTHRLVQEVTKANLGKSEQKTWAERASQAMSIAFPQPQLENRAVCGRLAHHAEALASHVAAYGLESWQTACLCSRLATYLFSYQGQTETAEPLLRRALSIFHQTGQENSHPEFGFCLDVLAQCVHEQRRYEEAESLYQRALDELRTSLGADDPSCAMVLGNLAVLYRDIGRYAEAKAIAIDCVERIRRTHGENNLRYATCLVRLADSYAHESQFDEAQECVVQAANIRMDILGKKHPDVAQCFAMHAGILSSTGHPRDAASLLIFSEKIFRAAYGDFHPTVATCLYQLANLRRAHRQFDGLESLYEEVVRIRSQVMDRTDPDFAITLHDLAMAYHLSGRFEDAKTMYEQAAKILGHTLGENHPAMLTLSKNYRALLAEMQDAPRLDAQDRL